jgi:hypothetical protein
MAFDPNQPAHRSFRDIAAERTSPLLAWTGSGLSVEAGLPTWGALRATLLDTLRQKADDLDPKGAAQLHGLSRAIEKQDSNWVAFKMLADGLGKTTYKETIRESFSTAPTVDLPNVYRDLWKLRIRGVLNLNLDRLATRALSERLPGRAPIEFSGRNVARLRQLLNGHAPFIGNLHGVFEDSESWVLTQSELAELLAQPTYRSFIEVCLSAFTILFIGLSADDLAVGGHLERLASQGIETPTHYWLTDRRDAATDSWAEKSGIRPIRYTAHEGDHSEIADFFSDVFAYVPEDTDSDLHPVAPTVSVADTPADLPAPEEMLKWDADSIRKALNKKAQELLADNSESAYKAYSDFCADYDQPIYQAWYTSTRPGDNALLGYKLVKDVARGSFGRVYSAESPKGTTVAVKVLLGEIRNDPDRLTSFRRGVRSMRILQQRKVDGMVAYLEESEIPAFVVMEWIDGPNLAEAVESRFLTGWSDILKVAVQLSRIVRRAHELPERVLHRDIRPSNVMLSGYYATPDEWSVVVLDFDLSWHKGALEKSVLHSATGGYLAPEQTREIKGVSTRNAAVDSFGLGMTLLYLCDGRDPVHDQHRHENWEHSVRVTCAKVKGKEWRSVAERVARVIIVATRDRQASRWDMAEIAGELERLWSAVHDPSAVRSTELLAEELAARSEVLADYSWDADRICAVRDLHTGMKIEVLADLVAQEVALTIDWASTGSEERKNLRKYITARATAAVDQLKANGWTAVSSNIDGRSVQIEARISSNAIQGRISEVAAIIDRATRRLQFDGT